MNRRAALCASLGQIIVDAVQLLEALLLGVDIETEEAWQSQILAWTSDLPPAYK